MPVLLFRWNNQGWGRMGMSIFTQRLGEIQKSVYGPRLMLVFRNSNLQALRLKVKDLVEKPTDSFLMIIDTKRCLQHVLMGMKDDVPVCTAFDEERKCLDYPGSDTEPWVPGEYLLPAFTICGGTVHYRSDWYQLCFASGR